MEAVIRNQMLEYLHRNDLISRQQHGFLAGRSACTQILETLEDWSLELRNGWFCWRGVRGLRQSIRFRVVHSKLLAKLAGYGIQYDLLGWIKEFLQDRRQRVVIGSGMSEISRVVSGVVQGSVLGTLLFLMFINDIDDLFLPPVKIKLFADDVKLYSTVSTQSRVNILENSIADLEDWAKKWQPGINEKMSSVMHLGKRNSEKEYLIAGTPLPKLNSTKDLGIVFSNTLNFGDHIEKIASKARQRTGILFRAFACRELKFLKLAFSIYRIYSTQVWSPTYLGDINRLESVQRSFTRRIPQLKNFPYHERLALIGLETLELRAIKKWPSYVFQNY